MGLLNVINVRENRRARKWSKRELLGRATWELLRAPLFQWTPRLLWGWRRFVLRVFGARIGREVHVYPSVRIAVPWNLTIEDESAVGERAILYSLGLIHIGPRVTVSPYAYLCAGSHDYRRRDFPLLKPPIVIEEGSWICTAAFVGPGVRIGANTVVGARAVVVNDAPAGVVVAGNPARPIGRRYPQQ